MKQFVLGMSLFACAFAGVGEVVTNRWLSAEGGSWTNAANWSDPVMLGTNDATCAHFDLSALAGGATVSIPYVQWGIRTKGVDFGSPDGADSDVWTLAEEPYNGDAKDRYLFYFRDCGDGTGKLRIDHGTLLANGAFYGSTIHKLGAGTLRLSDGWYLQNAGVRLDEGRLMTGNAENLRNCIVNVISSNALLDVTKDFYINRLDLNGMNIGSESGFSQVPLNGHAVRYFLPGWTGSYLRGSAYTGKGTITALGGGSLDIEVAQSDFTGVYSLGTADINLKSPQSRSIANYRFEDASNPGAASIGTDLQVAGNAQVVEDPERGLVLKLDGASHLAAPDPTKLPVGMCRGKGAYTVSFWVKVDSDVNKSATLFYFGKWNVSGACALIRLAEADGGGQPGKFLMFTNFSNNKFVSGDAVTSLYDGGWHRVTWSFDGTKQHRLWIDGALVGSADSTITDIQDGEFWIGYGKNGNHFKGCIDDFMVCSQSVDDEAISKGILDVDTPCLVNPASSVNVEQTGALRLSSPQTFATLGGTGSQGRIVLDGDLTVAGSGAESEKTEYKASITGRGGLVKRGADYELVLSGPNAYTGTTTVAEGTLTLKGQNRLETLVGRWTFEDAANPGKDTSGNGFDLSVSGSGLNVVADPDRGGNVVWFDGASRLVGTTASSVVPKSFPKGNDDYTLSLWLKGTSYCAAAAGVVVWGKTGVDNLCSLWRLDGSTGWMMTNWGQNHNSTVKNNFRGGTWHHVVWVRRGAEQTVYVDGQYSERWTRSGDLDVQMDGEGFHLAYNPFSGAYFTGWMDDVRIYNFALSESEAQAEFTGATASTRVTVKASLPEPVYKWTFEDEEAPGANTGRATDGALTVMGGARVSEGVDGRPGKVLDLRGETMGYLEAETFPASIPVGAAQWTVTCWVRPEIKSGNECALYWGDPSKHFVLLGAWDNKGSHRITVKSGTDLSSLESTFNLGGALEKWHHLAASYDGGTLRLYVDGKFVASKGGIGALNVGNTYFWIGRKQSIETEWYRGCIDDVEVYDSVLGEEVIRKLVRAEQSNASGPLLPPASPVVVEEGARLNLEGTDVTLPTLSGRGVVSVTGGTLTLTESCTFDGTLTLDTLNALSLAEGVTVKLTGRDSTAGGVRIRGGAYDLGDGRLLVGGVGSVVVIR